MPLNRQQILTHIGIAVAAQRQAVINDLMPTSLNDLQDLTVDDVKEACEAYAKRQQNPFHVPRLQISRLQGLCLWVKDRNRADALVRVPNGTDAAELAAMIREATAREKRRKEMKKTGEGLIDTTFNNKLKSQAQWQKFNEELKATLGMIIGLNGVPLTYVIRPDAAAANFDEDAPYEDAVLDSIELEGPEYEHDAKTVHQIILHNVPENSDAYTYIKPVLRNQNGREDIIRLRERFETDATAQALINTAKQSLANLRYKTERSFPFERFTAKLQAAYDELEDNGRAVNNGDIVDELWARIQAPELQQYIASLKVDYQRHPRNYKEILQDIASEVHQIMPASFGGHRNISEMNVAATYTRQGSCPSSGVYTANGEIYIGNYGKDRWFSDDVKPFHQQIRDARKADPVGNQPSRGQKRTASAIKRKKNQLKKLKTKIAAAKQQVAKLKSGSADSGSESEADDKKSEADDRAGDSFGGKKAKKANKKNG